VSDVTDPTIYHRLRINEALGFGSGMDAIDNLGGLIEDMEAMPEPDLVAIRTLKRVERQLFVVRALCAEGDET
jgi:hypothetical protein